MIEIRSTNMSLKGFDGEKLTPLGVVELPVTISASLF